MSGRNTGHGKVLLWIVGLCIGIIGFIASGIGTI